MIQAVIFDMDGVIADTEPMYFEIDRELLESYGIVLTKEKFADAVGMDARTHFGQWLDDFGIRDDIDKVLGIRERMKKKLFSKPFSPSDGFAELASEIRSRKLGIGLASSSNIEQIRRVLKSTGSEGMFDIVISGNEVDSHKPSPDIYLEAARRLGVSPHNCVAIEDTANGVASAKAAGMKCVGLATEFTMQQDLSAAEVIVNSLSELSVASLSKI